MKKRILSFLLTIIMLLTLYTAAFGAESLSLNGKSAIIVDCDTGFVIYEKDADTLRAPASMTKMMSLYTFFSRMKELGITKDTKVTVSKEISALSKKAGLSNVPLEEGEALTVDTLLKAACVVSANGAIVALGTLAGGSESGFVKLMNADAKAMGLNASFADASGLSDSNAITARSMAYLCTRLVKKYPQVLDYTSIKSFSFKGRNYSATNKVLEGLANSYPGTDGLKTGYTGKAGYCLSVTSKREGRRIIGVTMGCSSMAGRAEDGYALMRYGFRNLEQTVEPIYAIKADFSRSGEVTKATLSNVPCVFVGNVRWYCGGKIAAEWENATIADGAEFSVNTNDEDARLVISVGKYNVMLEG